VLGSSFHAGLAGRTAAERIFALEEMTPTALLSDGETIVMDSPPKLEFIQVSFTYPGGSKPAVEEMSFTIDCGQQVALVGASGAGKSTIADLIMGFIQPEAGVIKINGQDLNRLKTAAWLSHIAYVPQFPHLFYGTITDNILFGSDKHDEVEAAARAAGAHEFISRLPDGYDTVIGQGGIGLSGGEAQRIAIARALCKNAPVLILDEPMTGLDPQNETVIHDALLRLMAGKTVLVIAHRLTTASRADRILVLDKGKAVEAGTHQQLLAAHGLYYRMATAYGGET
jgi:ATP-binding cassette subfamily C protein CydD